MIRGNRSIFNSLFENDEPAQVVAKPERKGRSEHLINKRNELLICRYYYHIKIAGLQYIPTLKTLEEETFLAERTIIDALEKNQGILKALINSKPPVKYFRDKFPFYNWPN